MSIDRAAMTRVASWRRPTATRFLRLVSFTGEARSWLVVVVAFNLLQVAGVQLVPRQHLWLRALLGPLVAWGTGSVIKRIVARRRPELVGERLVVTPRDASFPSVHAATSTAFFVALLLLGHPFAAGVAGWAGLVCFSRVYLGVHYPSDVLGGIALGTVCGFLVPTLAMWLGGL